MNRIVLNFFAAATAIMAVACVKYETPGNKPSGGDSDTRQIYNIVPHRGGYKESGLPDCSIAGLTYSIALGCKYSEADIVLTKDNEVLVVHPTTTGGVGDVVNGLIPSQHTAEEIRAKAKLHNGETIPTLREFITFLQDKEKNPIGHIVWLDVKEMTVGRDYDYSLGINACLRACEIAKEMKAEKCIEFIVPSGSHTYPKVRDQVINTYKMNIAWMSGTAPANYEGGWAQLRWDKVIGDKVNYTPESYFNANVPLSIYFTETAAKEDEIADKVIPYYPQLKAICANYPKQLINKLKN